jgi:hypothetical protein
VIQISQQIRRLSATLAAGATMLLAMVSTPLLASHHNDSPTAKADSRLNITDLYVFPAPDGKHTVLVMNVSKDAGRAGAKNLHPDAVYDLAVDWDGDYVDDVRFRFRFDAADAEGGQAWRGSTAQPARCQPAACWPITRS